MAEEEFNKKEIKRYYCIRKEGYKNFRIINEINRDRLPDDNILLQMKEIAFLVLLNTDNDYIHFNLDKNIIHIKEKDIQWEYNELLSQEKINQLINKNIL